MKISDLSSQTGVSTASIKYYLREAMLPPGKSVGPRDAEYDEQHVERLEIIRSLRDIAHLPIATIKRLLKAADDQSVPLYQLMAMAHSALLPTPPVNTEELQLAATLYNELEWNVPERHPVFALSAHLLGILKRNGGPTDSAGLAPWIKAADQVAPVELGLVQARGSRALLVHDVVIGTHLSNQLLVAMHMAAQVNRATQQLTKP